MHDSSPINCHCCQLTQKALYCPACLREGITLHKELLQNLQTRLSTIRQHSQKLLTAAENETTHQAGRGLNAWRELRSDVASCEARCHQIKMDIAQRQAAISACRKRIAENNLRDRRESLSMLKSKPSPALSLRASIKQVHSQQQVITSRIIHARRVLVREAVNVFGVRQRSSGDWEIAGIPLPDPEFFRVYPSSSINAALSHVIHLVSLITTYLSVSLPFVPMPPPPFYHPHQLLVSFALLSFSIAYLAWSQDVPGIGIRGDVNDNDDVGVLFDEESKIPQGQSVSAKCSATETALISPASILRLIHAIAQSPTLGHRSHDPGGARTLKHLGFGLDVSKLVSTILRAEELQWDVKGDAEEGDDILSEGWDLLDSGAP
ncbi:hypothetical protein I309_05321 [Cryptococcus deuterogattii LA55]|nr:hypothetical protein I309_05321 [Cryptococcus deuterogattii LA55]KIR91025.1 hypothetical protein I304_05121 [Cryptococcus deuterogattii CBS 10090]